MKYYSIYFSSVEQLKYTMSRVFKIFDRKGIYRLNFNKKCEYCYDFTIGDELTFVCAARTGYDQKSLHEYFASLKILGHFSTMPDDGSNEDQIEAIYDWMMDKYRCREDYHPTKKLRFRHNFNILPRIKKVIFNNPATIVLWNDGTKTVVKCKKGDSYDQEKGLAMAISKKALGNKYNYYDIFKRWCKETVKEDMTYYADNIVEVHIKMEGKNND